MKQFKGKDGRRIRLGDKVKWFCHVDLKERTGNVERILESRFGGYIVELSQDHLPGWFRTSSVHNGESKELSKC